MVSVSLLLDSASLRAGMSVELKAAYIWISPDPARAGPTLGGGGGGVVGLYVFHFMLFS